MKSFSLKKTNKTWKQQDFNEEKPEPSASNCQGLLSIQVKTR